MNRHVLSISRYLVPALVIACGATTSLAQQGPPNGMAVTILNTPLPVTGSTTVTGSVNAAQNGAWNVGITGNSAANPLFVAGTTGGQKRFIITGINTPVPDGKQWVTL